MISKDQDDVLSKVGGLDPDAATDDSDEGYPLLPQDDFEDLEEEDKDLSDDDEK